MITTTRKNAMASRGRHAFVRGVGYVKMKPLEMPAEPVFPKAACEPPLGTVAGTWHMLAPPGGGEPLRFQWFPEGEWMPPLGHGKRVGFTVAYLSAHGWRYYGGSV